MNVISAVKESLFLISILHQTTTLESSLPPATLRCFLFQFYIKPQRQVASICILKDRCFLFQFYIKPQLGNAQVYGNAWLFLISILHQTTTPREYSRAEAWLFLISILHQTTTSDMRFVDCHSVMWPNERYERRMTGRGSRNDAGFVFQRYFSLKVECTSRARNRYMFAK